MSDVAPSLRDKPKTGSMVTSPVTIRHLRNRASVVTTAQMLAKKTKSLNLSLSNVMTESLRGALAGQVPWMTLWLRRAPQGLPIFWTVTTVMEGKEKTRLSVTPASGEPMGRTVWKESQFRERATSTGRVFTVAMVWPAHVAELPRVVVEVAAPSGLDCALARVVVAGEPVAAEDVKGAVGRRAVPALRLRSSQARWI